MTYSELHQAWLKLSPEVQRAILDAVHYIDFENATLIEAYLSKMRDSGLDNDGNLKLLQMVYYENSDD